jgi:hypothetical protein
MLAFSAESISTFKTRNRLIFESRNEQNTLSAAGPVECWARAHKPTIFNQSFA